MDRALWVAMTAARNTTLQEAANAHNLSNTGTTGFKAALHAFRTVPTEGGKSLPTRIYSVDSTAAIDFRQGAVRATGGAFDLALGSPGFFAVQDADGREAYTRAGDFSPRADGTLVDRQGRIVLGEAGPIVIPADRKIEIGQDGTVSALPQTPPFNEIAVLGRIKLVNPDPQTLSRSPDGLFRTFDRQALPAAAGVEVRQGALEDSNVSPVDGLMATIRNARAFELNMQLIQRLNTGAESTAKLLSIA